MTALEKISLSLASLLVSHFAQAQCSGGGMYDPQGGVCHQAGGGYTVPNSIQGGGVNNRGPWGAISIDVVNGDDSAISLNHRNKENADQAASKGCKPFNNCRVVASYKDSCGSIAAAADNDSYGVGIDVDPIAAERQALMQCKKKNSGNSCQLWIKARCSGGEYRSTKPTE